jgi:5-methylcytosine-specific restriction endonuclease McrA
VGDVRRQQSRELVHPRLDIPTEVNHARRSRGGHRSNARAAGCAVQGAARDLRLEPADRSEPCPQPGPSAADLSSVPSSLAMFRMAALTAASRPTNRCRGWCHRRATELIVYQRPAPTDPRRTYQWRKMRQRFKDRCRRANAPCHLCVARADDVENARIDYAAPRYSPNSFEADHVLPVETHPHLALVESNLRPCHSRCNRQRRSEAIRQPDSKYRAWVKPQW